MLKLALRLLLACLIALRQDVWSTSAASGRPSLVATASCVTPYCLQSLWQAINVTGTWNPSTFSGDSSASLSCVTCGVYEVDTASQKENSALVCIPNFNNSPIKTLRQQHQQQQQQQRSSSITTNNKYIVSSVAVQSSHDPLHGCHT